MPQLSVIIPSKNQGKFIPELINAFKKQSFQNFELIVIDSFSNDNSADLFREYNKVNFFSYNSSAADACIYGLKKAKGKYIMFGTTSDFIYSDKWLENAINKLNSDTNISLVWGSAVNINEVGLITRIWGHNFLKKKPPTYYSYLPYWFFNHYLPELNYVTLKKVFLKCRKNSKQFPLDWAHLFMLNFTKNGFLNEYIPDLAHAGRAHENSLTIKNKLSDFLQLVKLKLFQFIYLFQIFFGFKKHTFRDQNGNKLKKLDTFDVFFLPFKIFFVYVRELPKYFLKKLTNFWGV